MLIGNAQLRHDMRTVCNTLEQNEDAKLALEVFCFRAAKYIAAMSVSLSHLDSLIFTGGIGENATLVREKIVNHLSILGFEIKIALKPGYINK